MTIADLLGLGRNITFEGTTYTLRKPTLLQEARFSRRLEQRAMDAVARQTGIPDEDRDKLIRAVTRDIAAGYWEVDSPGYVEALSTPDGMAHMLYLTLSADHPDVTEERARDLVGHAMKEISVVLMASNPDPKVQAALPAVLTMLGLPPDFLSGSGSGSSASPTPPSTATPPTSAA